MFKYLYNLVFGNTYPLLKKHIYTGDIFKFESKTTAFCVSRGIDKNGYMSCPVDYFNLNNGGKKFSSLNIKDKIWKSV